MNRRTIVVRHWLLFSLLVCTGAVVCSKPAYAQTTEASLARFDLRAAAGVAASNRVEPQFDIALGARVRFDRGFSAHDWVPTVHPEGGYSYAGPSGGHLATLGLGVGTTKNLFDLTFVTTALLGGENGFMSAGARCGLRVEFVYGLFGVELGYQYVHAGNTDLQEFRAMISFDPVGALTGNMFAFDQ